MPDPVPAPNSRAFADLVIRRFLFNEDRTPDPLFSNEIITNSSNDRTPITVDLNSYMATVGRFALLSEFPIVQFFFNFFTQLEPKISEDGSLTFYSKDDLLRLSGLTIASLNTVEYNHTDAIDDVAVRSLIWGSLSFSIGGNPEFWVERDGSRSVRNFTITPRQIVEPRYPAENYDYESGDLRTSLLESTLQSWQDPNQIGVSQLILFSGDAQLTSSYSLLDYQSDRATASTWGGGLLNNAAAITQLIEDQFSDGVNRFLDSQNRPIYYGTNGADVAYADGADLLPALEAMLQGGVRVDLRFGRGSIFGSPYTSYLQNGIAFVGGDGDDFFVGGSNSDGFLSGSGTDRLVGGGGNDEFILGAGAKTVDGGAGVDTVRYEGGEGDALEIRVFTQPVGGSVTDRSLLLEFEHGGNIDRLTNIEIVRGSEYADTIRVFDLNFDRGGDVVIDLGGTRLQPQFADTLDLTGFGADTLINLRLVVGNQALTSGGATLLFRGVEAVIGGAFSDTIEGSDNGDDLRGGGGADTIRGGAANDTIYGANERFDDGAADQLYGGGGSDHFYVGNGDIINDLGSSDLIEFVISGVAGRGFSRAAPPVGSTDGGSTHRITGGERDAPPRNPCSPPPPPTPNSDDGNYEGADGAVYSLTGGRLTVNYNGQEVFVEAFRNGNGGITLRENRPAIAQAECNRDPLIIDLNGDRNVVRELFSSQAYFDLDNDGFRERVAWSLPEDGFLVRDLNGNGIIDNGNELFGSGRREQSAGEIATFGKDGFAELRALDTNNDGIISRLDTGFATLRVWVDANGDALTDDGELKTLEELGIVSISLATVASNDLDCGCDGTEIAYMSSVTLTSGQTIRAYDAYLSIDQYDTREIVTDVTVSNAIATLPFLIGTGTLSNLDVAMARDPALEEMVREFNGLGLADASTISQRVEQILLRWTNSDTIAADSRGPNMNARWLHAIEQISGSDFNQARIGANPRADAAAILNHEWQEIVARTTAQLLGQTALGVQLTPTLSFAAGAFFTVAPGTTLTSVFATIASHAPTATHEALLYWHAMLTTVASYKDALGVDVAAVDAAAAPYIVAAGLEVSIEGLRNAVVATGASGELIGQASRRPGTTETTSDLILIANGAEIVDGGGGADTFVAARSNGSVRIDDLQGPNLLRLTDVLRSEVGTSIEIIDGREHLIVATMDGAFSAAIGLSITTRGLQFDADRINFADGATIAVSDLIRTASLSRNGTAIVIGGTEAGNTLEGGPGSDLLMGFSTADVYRFGPSSGEDTVTDRGPGANSADRIVIDANFADVSFSVSRDANGSDLIIAINGSDARLTVTGQRLETGNQIEQFEFRDRNLTLADLDTVLNTGSPFGETIRGSQRSDVIEGREGDDVLRGGLGADTYVFQSAWGHDTLIDDTIGNVVRFGTGISAADITFRRAGADGRDLIVIHEASGSSILVNGGLTMPIIGEFRFDNGNTLPLYQVLATLTAGTTANRISGSNLNDTLNGILLDEDFYPFGGSNRINGNGGTDAYHFGGGRDQITASAFGSETLVAPAGAQSSDFRIYNGDNWFGFDGFEGDVIVDNIRNFEYVRFDDGTVIDLTAISRTTGTNGNDVLFHRDYSTATFNGGPGDDLLIGFNYESGNDTYLFEPGFGHDTIYDNGGRNDWIIFNGPNLGFENAQLSRSGMDLVVRFGGVSDAVTVSGYFWRLAYPPETTYYGHTAGTIETIAFDSGTTSRSFYYTEILSLLTTRTAGDDWVMEGLRDGGAGNDILVGGDGLDTYYFGSGYGNDVVKDGFYSIGGGYYADTVVFLGLARGDVAFSRTAADPTSVVVTIRATGETLTIDGTPEDGYNSNWIGSSGNADPWGGLTIESFQFTDGTLSWIDVIASVLATAGTSGDDTITGLNSWGTIDGGAGNDTIRLIGGYETIVVRAGSGNDVVSMDRIGRYGFTIAFEGYAADEVWAIPLDEVDGISGAHVRFVTSGGEAVTVLFGRDPRLRVQQEVGFFDSINLSFGSSNESYSYFGQAGPIAAPLERQGTPEDDLLAVPSSGALLDPGLGNDLIFGIGGTQTILFGRDYGTDRLIGQTEASDFFPNEGSTFDIELKDDIAPVDVSIDWSPSDPALIEISLAGSADRLVLAPGQLGTIRFADGSYISFDGIDFTLTDAAGVQSPFDSLRPLPTAEDDILRLTNGGEIDGLAGNDRIISIGGNVTVIFGEGSGSDRLEAVGDRSVQDGVDPDIVRFRGILSPDDLRFLRGGNGGADLVIEIRATGERLVVANQFGPSSEVSSFSSSGTLGYVAHVSRFVFDSGLTLEWPDVFVRVEGIDTGGANTVRTGAVGGVLDGGSGADSLIGGTGDDVYLFGRAYDEDRIVDAGGIDKVVFGPGILLGDIFFTRTGSNGDDLLIEVAGVARLTLTVSGQFGAGTNRVETFELGDGTLLTWAEVQDAILRSLSTGTADSLVGFRTDDSIGARAGDDRIRGAGGNDRIDGGAGLDEVAFSGNSADYQISTANGITTVRDNVANRDGTDTLVNVETLRFIGDGSTVSLVAPNAAPTAGAFASSGTEDGDIVIARGSLIARSFDPDGDLLTLAGVSGASQGRVWIDLVGDIRFRPDADFNGNAGFDYTVGDGRGETATGRVTLAVLPVNDAPVAVRARDAQTSSEDSLVRVTIPNDLFRDIDGDTLMVTATLANGSPLPSWLTLTGGVLGGTPPADFNGDLEIRLTASDGQLQTSSTFVLSILGVNDAPTLVGRLEDVTASPGTQVSIALPATLYTDVEGDPVSLRVTAADGGALPTWLTFDGARLSGTVPTGATGMVALAVLASDGHAVTSTPLSISILANIAPTLVTPLPDASFAEDDQINFAIPTGSFADANGDALTLTATLDSGGALPAWLRFDGTRFTGTPPSNFNGSVAITVTASDGIATASDRFSLTVTSVNDAPTVAALLPDVASPEDSPLVSTLPHGIFTDVDGDALTLSARLVSGAALPAWLFFDGARFTGTPPADFNGTLDIAVSASDGQLAASDTFALTISPVNDAPALVRLVPDQAAQEDASFSYTIDPATFTDVDGDVLSYTVSSLPAWLTFNAATRTFSGTPLNEHVGNAAVLITARDGSGATASDVFVISVDNTNDAPVAGVTLGSIASNEDTPFNFTLPQNTFTDVDAGDALSLTAVLVSGTALPSWISFDTATRTFRGTPPVNFDGDITIRVTATDRAGASASQTFVLDVLPVNDAPNILSVVTGGSVAENAANGTFVAQLQGTDPDTGAVLHYSLVDNAGGRFAVNAGTGAVTVANGNFLDYETAASHSIVARVTDQSGLSRDLTTVIAVTDVFEAPAYNDIRGSNGIDVLIGTTRADQISGLGGRDVIYGGDGNDIIDGGAGADILFGGSGADIFRYTTVSDAPRATGSLAALNREIIADFQSGSDRIDLSAIDANTRLVGDQAFSYIGGSAFGGVAGQLRYSGGILSGDVNGDRVADFEIQLFQPSITQPLPSLTFADFVL